MRRSGSGNRRKAYVKGVLTDMIPFTGRMTALILAGVLALPLLVSCGKTPAEQEKENAQAAPADPVPSPAADDDEEAETELPEETEVKDNLPDDLDFGGETVTLVWNPRTLMREINYESLNGEVVDDALFNAQAAACERLNVAVSLVPIESSADTQGDFVRQITKSVMAEDAAYDFIYGYSQALATLAVDGILTDLMSLDYIDLGQPWWAHNLLDQARVNNKLYFATGDISPALLYNIEVTYFNKNMIGDFGLEMPYDLVDRRVWTIDKMAEMCRGIYADLNGNGEADYDDRYGFSQSAIFADAFWFSSGLTYTVIDDEGVPHLSDDIKSQRAADLVEKITGYIFDGSHDMTFSGPPFQTGTVLFHSNELLNAPWLYRDVPFDFGIVPIATYEEGAEFITCASFTYQLYGIPIDVKDPDMSAAVMEALAVEGYKTVTPALFETALKFKYTTDVDSVRMLDIIRPSLNFDLGRLYNTKLNNLTFTMFRNTVNGNANWSSTLGRNTKLLEKQFEKLIASFD